MLDFDISMLTSAVATAVVALCMGVLSYWANPKRSINRAFLGLSLHVAVWLASLELALAGGVYGLFFVRTTTAIGAFIPFHLWLLKEHVAAPVSLRRVLRRGMTWFLFGVLLAVLCYTSWFIPPSSKAHAREYGWAYYVEIVADLGMFALLALHTWRESKRMEGVRRMELQVLILGSCLAAILIVSLMGTSAVMRYPAVIHLQPLVVLLAYAATAWAMLSSKICDAGHLLSVALHRVTMLALASVTVWGTYQLGESFMPDIVAFVIAVAVGLWGASELDAVLRAFFGLRPSNDAVARAALFECARHDYKPERLAQEYEKVLRGWAQTDFAGVLTAERGTYQGAGLSLEAASRELAVLKRLRWATPERLVRERSSESTVALDLFLQKNALGALAAGEAASSQVVLALGVTSTRRPYTYPQLVQLQEFVSIIHAGMERAQMTVRARRSEQLATVGVLGASLAHEIRNPLVTLKTFAQLYPERHQDPEFRTKFNGLLQSEVARIERLTEQLMDVASPHAYDPRPLSINQLVESSIELVSAKAREKKVHIRSDFRAVPDTVVTDQHAVRQVLLNLSINAMQAQEQQTRERWLLFTTRLVNGRVEVAVSDNGPGIAPEMRAKLFQAFSTSKSSGFGLGLAISGDILSELGATIMADPSVPGKGATFRIQFPEMNPSPAGE